MEVSSKIKTRKEVGELRSRMLREGKTVVFTNGCFDVLHRGHVEYLEKASTYGDVLVVGLNSDDSTRRLKGKGRPIIPQEDRAFILAALSAVNYISIFDEDTPLELIKIVKPDVLAKGGDYELDQIVGRDFVEERGGKVITIPLIPNRSTSEIIKKLIKALEVEN